MGKTTKIEWCDSTINPTMGCDGCELWSDEVKICYAGKLHARRENHPGFAPKFEQVTEFPGRMAAAAKWSDLTGTARPDKPWLDGLPRMIFISDMSDALSLSVSFEFLRQEIIENVGSQLGSRHRWMWLTKRPDRMAKFSAWLEQQAGIGWPSNLWAATSVTTQATVSRIRHLQRVGNESTTRFVSLEPQWEPVDLRGVLPDIDWLIQGGESGTIRNPFDMAWADDVREQCQEAGVTYFLKQLGTHVVEAGQRIRMASKKGDQMEQWPQRLQARAVPLQSKPERCS